MTLRRFFVGCLPASLTDRVFALYSLTLLLLMVLGMGLFLRHQYQQQVEEAQQASVMLVEVVAQALQDSVVIGDYDTVRKTLDKAVMGPTFASAAFIDVAGGKILALNYEKGTHQAPQWLVQRVQTTLYDVNRNVAVGGKDYGVLRLQFDAAHVAADLWWVSLLALGLGALSLVAGLVLIRLPLARWLGSLDQLRTLVEALGKGTLDAANLVPQDAPTEIRRVVDMFNQTAVLVQEREASRRALGDQMFALDQHAIVSITDRQGVITYANDRFCQISGYRREELVGQNHRTVKSGVHPAEFYDTLWRTISAGEVWHGEICNRNQSGAHYWVNASIVPLLGPDGLPDHYIAIRTDITDRKAIEHALQAAKSAAEEASVAKGQFLANMSHELRTPMNAILGMLKLLQSTEMTAQQLGYANKTEGAARSLLGLLNDILDFSKVEAGKMTLDPQPFRLDRLLRDLSVIVSANIGDRGIDVLFDVDPVVPKNLVGDDMRLRQILINLCGNAIKFTDHGEVVLRLRVAERSAEQVLLEFSVRDSGIGIAPEHQAHIFSGFSQAESSTTRRFGGTGLGLAICQRLVRLMGGELQLDSAIGRGSIFFFRIPLALGPELAGTPSSKHPMAALRTLVVDDNAVARELISGMTRSLGWSTDVAASGAQALLLAKQALAQDAPYQLVLVDWKMPDMDGWATSQHIRKLVNNRCLVLMVSAHGRDMVAQRSVAEQAILDGFLVKPVTASMLFDAVVDAAAARSKAAAGLNPAAPQPPASKPMRLAGLRLLVVEDNKINQLVAKGLLSQEGALVTLADNGQVGVQTLASSSASFDAVLMDVQMPVMDGYEATRAIRQELKLGAIPIVAMTANAMASDREACLAAGMNDHVGKPFEIDHLVTTLLRNIGSLPTPQPH
ncbi:MAG: response regulator [Rhodoferax sp.]|nr:response regulator [Rhodoferax sp.]